MKPKFATELAWQQAELLMQPAYIRFGDEFDLPTEYKQAASVTQLVAKPARWQILASCFSPKLDLYRWPQFSDVMIQMILQDFLFTAMFDDFFGNVLRYQSYFVSIVLGVFISTFSWLKPLLNNKITATALIGLMVGLISLVVLTLKAMLGFTPVA